MNIANKLTLTRIGLTFVFMFFLFLPGLIFKSLALSIFCLACLSDYLDGFLARRHNVISNFGIKVKVKIREKDVYCKVWKVNCFGNADLYLLDTDIEENNDRWITGRLYGGFAEERIAQEMVLGIGGVRALRALNIPVDIYHFNDGHAVFAGLELMNEKMKIPYETWMERLNSHDLEDSFKKF